MQTRDYSGINRPDIGAVAPSTSDDPRLLALWERLQRQESELKELRALLSTWSGPAISAPQPPAEPALSFDTRAEAHPSTGRRTLLKSLSAGAAAVVGTSLVVAGEHMGGATPKAEAADVNFLLDVLNTATSNTKLTPVTGANPDTLLTIDNSASTSTAPNASALIGTGPAASTAGQGVIGIASGSSSAGILGQSDTGYGVVGSSSSGVDLFAQTQGRILQQPQLAAGAPTSGSYSAGEQIRDLNGDLFICTTSGTPGTWKKVAATPAGAQGGAVGLLSAPIRLLDTLPGAAGALTPGHTIPGMQAISVPVAGVTLGTVTIPAAAVGVVGNVTVVNPQGPGNLTIYPTGAARPNTSAINYQAGQILGNNVTVGLGTGGKIDIFVDANSATDLVFDATAFII